MSARVQQHTGQQRRGRAGFDHAAEAEQVCVDQGSKESHEHPGETTAGELKDRKCP